MTDNIPNLKGIRGSIVSLRDAGTPVYYEDGGVVWDRTGTIVACDTWEVVQQRWGTLSYDDWRGHLVTPGFVDCHVHLPQLDCRNKTGYRLLDWLDKYIFPAEAMFADPALARTTARRFFAELLRHGTTTAMIHSTIHEVATHIAFEEAERSGIRAIIGKVMMDQHCPTALQERTSDSLRTTESLIARWHGKAERLYYAVTPRFALTCSRALLEGAGKLAAQARCYFQTHIAETQEEVRRAHQMHHIQDYVGLWGDCQCLGPQSMFAHAIYVSDGEWKQLSQTQSAVAHCPSSNIFLQSGRMPYEKIAEFAIRCGLGSDVGAGPEFSLWDVIRCGMTMHTEQTFSALEGLYRATLGGAAALGMAERIGSFAVGKQADIAVFHHAITGDNLTQDVRQIATRQSPVLAVATYVNGTCCYRAAE